jgi:hypothetical protein
VFAGYAIDMLAAVVKAAASNGCISILKLPLLNQPASSNSMSAAYLLSGSIVNS